MEGNWLQRLFAGRLIDRLIKERDKYYNYWHELGDKMYNLNARIESLQDDNAKLKGEYEILEAHSIEIETEYNNTLSKVGKTEPSKRTRKLKE